MSGMVLNLVIFAWLVGLFIVFLILEYRAIRATHGGWRAAATLPAMIVGWIVLGIILNPPAHALWPVEIILWLLPGIVVLMFLRLVKGDAGRAAAGTQL